jgi:hypothetical protein
MWALGCLAEPQGGQFLKLSPVLALILAGAVVPEHAVTHGGHVVWAGNSLSLFLMTLFTGILVTCHSCDTGGGKSQEAIRELKSMHLGEEWGIACSVVISITHLNCQFEQSPVIIITDKGCLHLVAAFPVLNLWLLCEMCCPGSFLPGDWVAITNQSHLLIATPIMIILNICGRHSGWYLRSCAACKCQRVNSQGGWELPTNALVSVFNRLVLGGLLYTSQNPNGAPRAYRNRSRIHFYVGFSFFPISHFALLLLPLVIISQINCLHPSSRLGLCFQRKAISDSSYGVHTRTPTSGTVNPSSILVFSLLRPSPTSVDGYLVTSILAWGKRGSQY